MLVRFLARQPGKLGERISPNGSSFLSTIDKAVATSVNSAITWVGLAKLFL